MNIVEMYSHLNGHEHILVHKPHLWQELLEVIADVDATQLRTKISQEKRSEGQYLYSPVEINKAFTTAFEQRGWQESRTSYWVTSDQRLIRKTMHLSLAEQFAEITQAGHSPIKSYNQTDFVKDRIAIYPKVVRLLFSGVVCQLR